MIRSENCGLISECGVVEPGFAGGVAWIGAEPSPFWLPNKEPSSPYVWLMSRNHPRRRTANYDQVHYAIGYSSTVPHAPVWVPLKGFVAGEYSAPLLATTPGRPGLVAVGMPGLSPADVSIHQIVGDSFVLQASSTATSNLRDIALSTDGSLLYAAAGASSELQSFTTDSLALRAGYAVGAYPNAVAVSRDANVLAAGVDAYYDPDVFIYRNGQFAPSRVYDFADLQTDPKLLAPGGLAWGPGGKWLYAVTSDFETAPTLNILRG